MKKLHNILAGVLLIALVMVLFTGCGSDAEFVLDEQGNLNCITWGCTLSEAQAQLPKGQISDDTTMTAEGTFLGHPATLVLQFSYVPGEDQPILYDAEIVFSDDTDMALVSDEMTQLLGSMETEGETQNGEKYDLQEVSYYWHGSQVLSELVDEQSVIENLETGKSEFDSEYMSYVLRTSWPVTITISQEENALCLNARNFVDFDL